MPPEFQKPQCPLTLVGRVGEPASHWTVISEVLKTLKKAGLSSMAQEFARRAIALEDVDDDTTELLILVQEYVEIV
jgi:hypothetical protein